MIIKVARSWHDGDDELFVVFCLAVLPFCFFGTHTGITQYSQRLTYDLKRRPAFLRLQVLNDIVEMVCGVEFALG
jgi:hypothetical protein